VEQGKCGCAGKPMFPTMFESSKGADLMPPRTAKAAAVAREKWFLALIVTLAVAQLIAFWMLCSHQVQQAQAREAGVQVRTATAPKALHPDAVLAADEKGASLGAVRATPVNFSLH
jgi:hypothetical protein